MVLEPCSWAKSFLSILGIEYYLLVVGGLWELNVADVAVRCRIIAIVLRVIV